MLERLRSRLIPLRPVPRRSPSCWRPTCSPNNWRDNVRETAFDLVLASDRWLSAGRRSGGRSRRRGRHRPPLARGDRAMALAAGDDGGVGEAVSQRPSRHWRRSTSSSPAGAAMRGCRSRAAAMGRRPAARPGASGESGRGRQPARAIGRGPAGRRVRTDPEGSAALRRIPIVTRGSPSLPALWAAPAPSRRPRLERERGRHRRLVVAGDR
jgi:hypothetical protein